MFEQMLKINSFSEFWSKLHSQISTFSSAMDSYLSNTTNLRTLSIVLMMSAIVLFLFLIAVLYMKSVSSMVKSQQSGEINLTAADDAENKEDDAERLERIREEDLEKELSRELEKAIAEKAQREEQEMRQKELEEKNKEDDKLQAISDKMPEIKKRLVARNDNVLDLDWQKGKLKDMEDLPEPPDIPLKYQQSCKKLDELVGLIINMIGRHVDDNKIAQAIMYRNMNQESEEVILQTIDAIKDFIALCINGKFTPLRENKKLPEENAALYNLAMGDSSPALALLENLMDYYIDKGAALTAGDKRDEIFAMTSNYAITFGTLAAIADVHLATGAFELAIELYPQNINGWNRIGDMYKLAGNEKQAIKSYENVVNLADDDLNMQQIANAQKMLSEFYYEQGDSLKAAQLHNESKKYYDSIGINRRLDKQEAEIIEIMESNQDDGMKETIRKILENQSLKQYSFA